MDIKDYLIVGSVLLTIPAGFSYLKGIIKRQTKPKLVSWLNWALLTLITGSASLSDRQYAAAIMSYSAAALCLTIAVVGFRFGSRNYQPMDLAAQIGIIITLLLWWLLNSADVAIISVIIIDMIALAPTILHAWQKPKEENWQLFLMSSLSAILIIFAARTVRITSLANPIYIAIADFATSVTIFYRQRL